MNASTLRRILAIGTITGMRSMAGPAIVARAHGGLLQGVTALMAAGEMAADKTTAVGNRTDPLPLAGRAVIGAAIGGFIAREGRGSIVGGALLGAAAAIAAAHVAYQLRSRMRSTVAGGLLEDAIVIGAGAVYTRNR